MIKERYFTLLDIPLRMLCETLVLMRRLAMLSQVTQAQVLVVIMAQGYQLETLNKAIQSIIYNWEL
jgi:DNA-binding MurR/RpiR family transcriptional regulator